MSIATEITRLQNAKTDIKTAIEAKGVTVSSSAKLDTYDDYIAQISGGGSNPLKFGVLRPDAELIKTFSYDKYIVEDEKVTLPAYNTTTQTLKASETLTETVATDLTTYNYYVLIRMLTIPKYNTNAIAKGRFE